MGDIDYDMVSSRVDEILAGVGLPVEQCGPKSPQPLMMGPALDKNLDILGGKSAVDGDGRRSPRSSEVEESGE